MTPLLLPLIMSSNLFERAWECLQAKQPNEKCDLTHALYQDWGAGRIVSDNTSQYCRLAKPVVRTNLYWCRQERCRDVISIASRVE